MRELGPQAPTLHRDLVGSIGENGVDLVFAAGPLMRDLYESLPTSRRGRWAEQADGMADALLEALAPGDVVMVKGSNASRMGPLVHSLKAHFSQPVAA